MSVKVRQSGAWLNVDGVSAAALAVLGVPRVLDLGVITAAQLGDGAITLYTPAAGEIAGPVLLRDLVYAPSIAVVIGRDEMVAGSDESPPLAAWDSDLARDSVGMTVPNGTVKKILPTTTGPVKIGVNEGSIYDPPLYAWQANHVYDSANYANSTIAIAAAGHIWEGSNGTSGGSAPNWASGFGGTVNDGDIVWTDYLEITTGSAHVYLVVQKPVAYP